MRTEKFGHFVVCLCLCLTSHQRLRSYGDRLEKPEFQPTILGLQGMWFSHYTKAAPFVVNFIWQILTHFIKVRVTFFHHQKNDPCSCHNYLWIFTGLQIRVRIGKLFSLFLIQKICCGYSKEPSQWDGSFEHPKHMFKLMGKKIITISR